MKFDFHVHSNYSDGDFSLSELAAMALKADLGGFAITDHDTIAGWQEAAVISKEFGITIVPGVEISTEWEDKDVHILAYGLTEESRKARKLLEEIREGRILRIRQMVKKCREHGLLISEEEVFAIVDHGSPGRPHVAKALVQKGYAATVKEVFHKYLARGGCCYVPREKVSPFSCVALVREEGGYPVLAHPGIDKNFRLAEELKNHGLWGLEVYHSSHSPGEEIRFLQLAHALELKVFAGSDFHGFHCDGHGNIGSKYIEVDCLEEIFQ